MNYRKLGRSGLTVSDISLGSWRTAGGDTDAKNFRKILFRSVDLGVNLIDTAEVYRHGEAECIIGSLVGELNRHELVLATKCSGWATNDHRNVGLNKKHMVEACNQSLRNLNTDYVDLYQFHKPDPTCPLEESVRAIGLLLRQGKVLYWGLSNYSLEETADVVRLCDGLGVERPVSMQPKYNMFHRGVENSLVNFCEANGMGLIVYSPLDQGLLTGKYRKSAEIPDDSRLQTFDSRKTDEMLAEDNLDAVEALLKIAEQCGVTLVQLALAWVLRRTAVSSAICGATKVSQLESNVTASGVELSEETLAGVEEVLQKRRARIRIRDHEKTLRQGK